MGLAGHPSKIGRRQAGALRTACSVAAVLLLSACVASPTADNALNASLQSAATNTPDQALTAEERSILDASDAALAEEQILALASEPSRLPRPVASPVTVAQPTTEAPTTDLALAQTGGQTPAAEAAQALVTDQPSAPASSDGSTPTPITTAAAPTLQQPAAAQEEAQSANADDAAQSQTPTTIAAARPNSPRPRATVQASNDPRDGAGRPKAAKATGGLFGLFAARQPQPEPRKTVTPARGTVGASAARASGSNEALPGVKRQSALFGIGTDTTGPSAGEEALQAMGARNPNQNGVQVASVGGVMRSLSPSGLVLQTERVQVDCFKPELLAVLKKVERRYGKRVMVTSGYRSPKRNRRAGGASNSMHIYCKAADIQIDGVSKWDLAKYLRSIPGRGGVGTYCRTESVHIDVGSKRDWHHPCRRKGSKARRKA